MLQQTRYLDKIPRVLDKMREQKYRVLGCALKTDYLQYVYLTFWPALGGE